MSDRSKTKNNVGRPREVDRKVVQKLAMQGLSTAEIANILHKPHATIFSITEKLDFAVSKSTNGRPRKYKAKEGEIILRALNEESIIEISQVTDVPYHVVRMTLQKANVDFKKDKRGRKQEGNSESYKENNLLLDLSKEQIMSFLRQSFKDGRKYYAMRVMETIIQNPFMFKELTKESLNRMTIFYKIYDKKEKYFKNSRKMVGNSNKRGTYKVIHKKENSGMNSR